jgi:hypothetical protein
MVSIRARTNKVWLRGLHGEDWFVFVLVTVNKTEIQVQVCIVITYIECVPYSA